MREGGAIHVDKAGQDGFGNQACGQDHDHRHVVVLVGHLAHQMHGQPAVPHPDEAQATRTHIARRQEGQRLGKGEQDRGRHGRRGDKAPHHPLEPLEHERHEQVERRRKRQPRQEQHARVRDFRNGVGTGEIPRPVSHQVRPHAQERETHGRANRQRPVPPRALGVPIAGVALAGVAAHALATVVAPNHVPPLTPPSPAPCPKDSTTPVASTAAMGRTRAAQGTIIPFGYKNPRSLGRFGRRFGQERGPMIEPVRGPCAGLQGNGKPENRGKGKPWNRQPG